MATWQAIHVLLALKIARAATSTQLTNLNAKHAMSDLCLILRCRIVSFNATLLLSLTGPLVFVSNAHLVHSWTNQVSPARIAPLDVSPAFTTMSPTTPNVFLATLPTTRLQSWISWDNSADLRAKEMPRSIGHLKLALGANLTSSSTWQANSANNAPKTVLRALLAILQTWLNAQVVQMEQLWTTQQCNCVTLCVTPPNFLTGNQAPV